LIISCHKENVITTWRKSRCLKIAGNFAEE